MSMYHSFQQAPKHQQHQQYQQYQHQQHLEEQQQQFQQFQQQAETHLQSQQAQQQHQLQYTNIYTQEQAFGGNMINPLSLPPIRELLTTNNNSGNLTANSTKSPPAPVKQEPDSPHIIPPEGSTSTKQSFIPQSASANSLYNFPVNQQQLAQQFQYYNTNQLQYQQATNNSSNHSSVSSNSSAASYNLTPTSTGTVNTSNSSSNYLTSNQSDMIRINPELNAILDIKTGDAQSQSKTTTIPIKKSRTKSTSSDSSANSGNSNSNSSSRRKRQNLPRQTTLILLSWLSDHLDRPYPNSREKYELLIKTHLSIQQLDNWFINARRRKISILKKMKETDQSIALMF